MKIGIVIAIFMFCGLGLVTGAFATPYGNNGLNLPPVLTGDENYSSGYGYPERNPIQTLGTLNQAGEHRLATLDNIFQDIVNKGDAALDDTSSTVEYVYNTDGVLTEIRRPVNGQTVGPDITKPIKRVEKTIKLPGIPMSIASAQLVNSTLENEDGSTYEQVQIVIPLTWDDQGRVSSRFVAGYTVEDRTVQHFMTTETNMKYKNGQVVSSDNKELTGVEYIDLEKAFKEIGYESLLNYVRR
jgi:hypothetical protein